MLFWAAFRSNKPLYQWVYFLVHFVQQLSLARKNTTKKPHPCGVVPLNTIIGRCLHFPVEKYLARRRTVVHIVHARLRMLATLTSARVRTLAPR